MRLQPRFCRRGPPRAPEAGAWLLLAPGACTWRHGAHPYALPAVPRRQVLGLLGAGGLAGQQLASRIKITDLPQMVAGFHS